MFLTSSMSSAPGVAPGRSAAKKSKNADVSRQIDNLDCRLRPVAGDRVTYFFSTGRSPGVVAQVKAARPQQESNTHGSSAQLDSDVRERFALRRGEGRGGSPQHISCSTTQTVPTRSVDRTQNDLAALHEPVTPGKRWELASQPNAIPANLSYHSCASHWKQREEYRRQERFPREPCSNEAGQIRTRSCVWETYEKCVRLLFSKSLNRYWSICGCSCGCSSSSCR